MPVNVKSLVWHVKSFPARLRITITTVIASLKRLRFRKGNEHDNKELRYRAAVKISNIINSCKTIEHCNHARRMVERFQERFDPKKQLPLNAWMLNKECEITHPYNWTELLEKHNQLCNQ